MPTGGSKAKKQKKPTPAPWQAYQDKGEIGHPDAILRKFAGGSEDKYLKFLAEPLTDWFFFLWMTWLNILFRSDLTELQVRAYGSAFKERSFTNKDFVTCCRWIEDNLFRFPMLADWVNCPELPGNESAAGDRPKRFGGGSG